MAPQPQRKPVVFGNRHDNVILDLPAEPQKGDKIDVYPDMVNDQTGNITRGRIMDKKIEVGDQLPISDGGTDLPTYDYKVLGPAKQRQP